MVEIQEVDPLEVSRRLRAGESLRLVDVRERDEWAISRIEGAELRPLSEIRWWQHDIRPEGGPYVFYCHHGLRSRWACAQLARVGGKGLINMRGGIDLWSLTVDPDIPRY